MTEETYIMTKEAIKEAVSESLLEALQVANLKKNDDDHSLNSGLNWVLNLLNKLMPLTLLAMMGWIALTIVDNQKDLVAMRIRLAAIDNSVQTWMDKDAKKSTTSALLHHSANVSPCNGCHTRNGIVVHALASLPARGRNAGELFEIKCGSCHTLDRVLTKTATAIQWHDVIAEMRKKRLNWISAKEADIIADYINQLEKHKP